jgi:hypothetical protein
MQKTGDAPGNHGQLEGCARAHAIDEGSCDQVSDAIAEQECRGDRAELGVVDAELGHQRRRRHREGLPVQVIDRGYDTQEPGDLPADLAAKNTASDKSPPA